MPRGVYKRKTKGRVAVDAIPPRPKSGEHKPLKNGNRLLANLNQLIREMLKLDKKRAALRAKIRRLLG